MRMIHFELPLLLYCFVVFPVSGISEKKELIRKYLKETLEDPNYDKRILPDGERGIDAPVDVNISMYIVDISSLNEQKMEFEVKMYLRQSWYDHRLKYDIPNVTRIDLIEVDKIWTPDLFFINEVEGTLHKIMKPNILCAIKPDGSIFYSAKLFEKLKCLMDFRKFPFDTQTCSIAIESYGFNSDKVHVRWFPHERAFSVTSDLTLPNFELINFKKSSMYIGLNFGNYSSLKVNFTFKRKSGFYSRSLYAPFCVLVLLSYLSFWIGPEEKHMRLVLSLVMLSMMIVSTYGLQPWIPYTAYTKSSDVWIGVCAAFVSVALLESIAVIMFYRNEPFENRSWGKIEMSPILDNEAKEQSLREDSFKVLLNQMNNQSCARRRRQVWATNPIDRICRYAFLVTFGIFNIVYWSVYSTS